MDLTYEYYDTSADCATIVNGLLTIFNNFNSDFEYKIPLKYPLVNNIFREMFNI